MSAEESKVKVGEWDVVKDKDDSVYYENRSTKERAAVMPQSQWVQRVSPDGKLFWKNQVTGEKRWRPPPEQSEQAQNMVSSPPPSLSQRASLPDESPSKVAMDALRSQDSKSVENYKMQLELLGAERNIEVDLRKNQEEKYLQLQQLLGEQQRRLAKLEENTKSKDTRRKASDEPLTPPSTMDETWREWQTPKGLPYWAHPASGKQQFHRPASQDEKMTPERAYSLAKEICNTAAPSNFQYTNDPRAAAEHLLTQYIKESHKSGGFPKSPSGNLPQYPAPHTIFAPNLDLAPHVALASKMAQGAGDQQVVFNLNLTEDGTGKYAFAPQPAASMAQEQVVNVALDVYHDGKGGLMSVQPSKPLSTTQEHPVVAVSSSSDSGQCMVDVQSSQNFTHPKGMGKAKVRKELETQREMLHSQQEQLEELQGTLGEVLKNQQLQMHTQGQGQDQSPYPYQQQEQQQHHHHHHHFQHQPQLQHPGQQQQRMSMGPGTPPSARGSAGDLNPSSMYTGPLSEVHPRPPLPADHVPKSMCPISEFRQYEMADTMERLQALARTRPGQGRAPINVPLPSDAQMLQPADPSEHQFKSTQHHGTGKRRSIPL